MLHSTSLKESGRFRALYARGKSSGGKRMVVYCMKSRFRELNRIGITVSAKLGGAVVRNRTRRRLREVYRLMEANTACGFDVVVVARHAAIEAPFEALQSELISHFKKLGMMKNED